MTQIAVPTLYQILVKNIVTGSEVHYPGGRTWTAAYNAMDAHLADYRTNGYTVAYEDGEMTWTAHHPPSGIHLSLSIVSTGALRHDR